MPSECLRKVSDMRTVETLIDEAVELCKGQAGLARRLGWTPQDVHTLVKGKRAVTPETVALLCDVLELPGEEAQRLAALAVIANAKNAPIREVLRRAFFGLSVAGAVCGAAVTLTPERATASAVWRETDGPAGTAVTIEKRLLAGVTAREAHSVYIVARRLLRLLMALATLAAHLRRIVPETRPAASVAPALRAASLGHAG
jgi:plasmid maintenance system antidote protein VapI